MNKAPISTDGTTVMSAQPAPMMGVAQPVLGIRQAHPSPTPVGTHPATAGDNKVLDKRRLQELVKEVDPLEQLDDDVEEVSKD